MTPQMGTALAGRRVLLAGLLRIGLPGHTLLLCDGAGTLVFGGESYSGRDATFGTIGAMEAVAESAGDQAPGVDCTILPPDLAGAVALCQPGNQQAAVRIWLAAVDVETGLVVPDPELLFAGEIDTAALDIGRGQLAVKLGFASVFERLQEPDEGARLSDSFHQSIFPGELGLQNMTSTTITELWGPGDKPPAAVPPPAFPRTGVQQYF